MLVSHIFFRNPLNFDAYFELLEPTNNEDFGVEQTETLQHFAKPRPPSNRRRPMTTKKSKVTPMTNIKEDEEEPSDLQISRELPPKVEIQEIEEEKVQLRSQVMRQLSNSLRSKSLSDTPPNVVNSDSTSIKPRAGSDIFTQRFKSHNTEGIENPTSL